MGTRRELLSKGLAGLAGLVLLPSVNSFADPLNRYRQDPKKKLLLRFVIASDIHYGQPGTAFEDATAHMVRWINDDHDKNHIDLAVINGDLVHNRPDLLPEIKTRYLDKLRMPYYTIPGNHDFADASVWQKVFGYSDHYTSVHGDIAFILANTADTQGKYICPDKDFLKSALEQMRGQKIVFVILHIPPVKWIPEDPFLDCPEVVALLQHYRNVKALFHGHDHSLDGVRYSNKLPHFFDAHIGGDWGTAYKGYRIVEVADDFTIYTYQVNASQNPVLNNNTLS